MSENRGERRRRQKGLRAVLLKIERQGIPFPCEIWHVAALAMGLVDKLAGARAGAAIMAAEYRHSIYDRSLRTTGAMSDAACKRGCSFCCKNYVSALPPDIFAIAASIRKNAPGQIERIVASEQVTRGLDADQRLASRDPCVLLVNEVCSIYPLRPLACRGFASFSYDACKISFDGGADDIPAVSEALGLRAGCDQALFAALHSLDLPFVSYELNHAISVALTNPNAEAQWLAGENIFAEVEPDPGSSILATLPEAKLMIDVLVALSRGETPAENPWLH